MLAMDFISCAEVELDYTKDLLPSLALLFIPFCVGYSYAKRAYNHLVWTWPPVIYPPSMLLSKFIIILNSWSKFYFTMVVIQMHKEIYEF